MLLYYKNLIRAGSKRTSKHLNITNIYFLPLESFNAFFSAHKSIPEKINKPTWIEYNSAKLGKFSQKIPKLCNPYVADPFLQRYLDLIPKEVSKKISEDLKHFGERIMNEIDDLGSKCELYPPVLEIYDAWGNNVNNLQTCNEWKRQHAISAEEGLIAIAYEKKLYEWSRLHQVCKLYMYAPSSGLYTCPLAMTDGAAKTIEVIGKENIMLEKAYRNLVSRDPSKFWTSGQWMTEKRGGSDVSNATETIAIPENDYYRLYGLKWFTSAIDSNMALTLAREMSNNSDCLDNNGLTLFYLETRNSEGQLNNMQLLRLKNKLGTRQLPTAELLLDGTIAHKMCEKGKGISVISNMLNITRLYNAVCAVGSMRRILMLAREFSQHRIAFGKPISQHPLYMQVLSRMEVETRGCFLLIMKTAVLLGKTENNIANEHEKLLLRLILPLLKLYTAKQAVSVISEGLEAFGGQGYMEDTGLPVLLRDAQVLPIWEGTTNIMALDVIRSFFKSNFECLEAFEKFLTNCLELGEKDTDMNNCCTKVKNSFKYIKDFIQNYPHLLNVASRDLSYSLVRTYIGALLIENACLTKNKMDVITAQRWCTLQDLCPLMLYNENWVYKEIEKDMLLVMEEYNKCE